jgi:hypothetical protein
MEVLVMLYRLILTLFLLLFISCRGKDLTDSKGFVSYEISFNTDKNYIINEASFILQLYEYNIEILDPTKDYYVIQTFWRLRDGQMAFGSDTVWALFRDRVLMHIIPRGRSSFYFRGYQVYNTVLQFEFQVQMGQGNWVKATPPKEYISEYETIIKEIKRRMLRYGPSSGE